MKRNYDPTNHQRKVPTRKNSPNRHRPDRTIDDWHPDEHGRKDNRTVAAIIRSAVEGNPAESAWRRTAGRIGDCGIERRLRKRLGDDGMTRMYCHNRLLCRVCRLYLAKCSAPRFAAHALLLRREVPTLRFSYVTLTAAECESEDLLDADEQLAEGFRQLVEDRGSELHKLRGARVHKHFEVTHDGNWWPHLHVLACECADSPIDWDRVLLNWSVEAGCRFGVPSPSVLRNSHVRHLDESAHWRVGSRNVVFEDGLASEVANAVYYGEVGPNLDPADRWFARVFSGNHLISRGNMIGAGDESRLPLAAELVARGVFDKTFVSPRFPTK